MKIFFYESKKIALYHGVSYFVIFSLNSSSFRDKLTFTISRDCCRDESSSWITGGTDEAHNLFHFQAGIPDKNKLKDNSICRLLSTFLAQVVRLGVGVSGRGVQFAYRRGEKKWFRNLIFPSFFIVFECVIKNVTNNANQVLPRW